MHGPGLWWPVYGSRNTHYMLDSSQPGDFRFACGLQRKLVLSRTHETEDADLRCETCLSKVGHNPTDPPTQNNATEVTT